MQNEEPQQRRGSIAWDAIVVTGGSHAVSSAYLDQLKSRRGGTANHLIPPSTLLLSVADPVVAEEEEEQQQHGGRRRLGSGAATFNALLVVAEHLSARAGFNYVCGEVLREARVLLLHVGGAAQRLPFGNVCGKAFSPLPWEEEHSLLCPIDILLRSLARMFPELPAGLMVASTEAIFLFSSLDTRSSSPSRPASLLRGCCDDTESEKAEEQANSIYVVGIPSSVALGEQHGVCKVDPQTEEVETILYRQPRSVLREAGAILSSSSSSLLRRQGKSKNDKRQTVEAMDGDGLEVYYSGEEDEATLEELAQENVNAFVEDDVTNDDDDDGIDDDSESNSSVTTNNDASDEDTNEKVLLYSGIVFFGHQVTERLLNLNATPPLDLCTYLAVDNGARPIYFELYSDLLLCVAKGTDHAAYLSMPTPEQDAVNRENVVKIRNVLWNTLRQGSRPVRLKCLTTSAITNGRSEDEPLRYVYLRSTAELHDFLLQPSSLKPMAAASTPSPLALPFKAIARSSVGSSVLVSMDTNGKEIQLRPQPREPTTTAAGERQKDQSERPLNVRVVNSRLDGNICIGEGTVIEHCLLDQGCNLRIGRGCFLSGIRSLSLTSSTIPASTSSFSCLGTEATSEKPAMDIGDGLYVADIALLDVEVDDEVPYQQPPLHYQNSGTRKLSRSKNHDQAGLTIEESLRLPQRLAGVVLGIRDDISLPLEDPAATFMNIPWATFVKQIGWRPKDIWPHILHRTSKDQTTEKEKEDGDEGLPPEFSFSVVPPKSCFLYNAKLFPVHFNCTTNSPRRCPDLADVLRWYQRPEEHVKELQRWKEDSISDDGCLGASRLSLEDIFRLADVASEFMWRRNLGYSIDLIIAEQVLTQKKDECLLAMFARFAKDKSRQHQLLNTRQKELLYKLDTIAASAAANTVINCYHPHQQQKEEQGKGMTIVMRTLASIADALVAFAGRKAGLRSGPARNRSWREAFDLLEKNKLVEAVGALAMERERWLQSPEALMRAARHYEGAAQILVKKCMQTIQPEEKEKGIENVPERKVMDTLPKLAEGEGKWIVVEAPVRIDVAGGWTDTPPICFEHRGCVVNIALKMEGKKPIVAKARRIPEPVIIMHLGGEGTTHTTELCCRECSHLSDFAQPLAAGALLKTIILYMGIVDLASSLPLQQQLKQNIGGGLEIACATDLPQGSGLGTSSILAGAALRAVEMAVGRNSGKEGSKGERKTLDSLVDAVILVEQMLTTGGGWQDQVGGLFPGLDFTFSLSPIFERLYLMMSTFVTIGIKYTTSPAKLPLEVNVDVLEVPSTFLELLNQHLLLIYTGIFLLLPASQIDILLIYLPLSLSLSLSSSMDRTNEAGQRTIARRTPKMARPPARHCLPNR
ncbi:Fucose kinase [Balamuthia mandrillaris]